MSIVDRERWPLLEPLLDRALSLSGEEKARWLAELSVSAPDLATELARLLGEDSQADASAFLATPLELGPADLQLGAYTLDHPLGHGGMGSVWLAHRTDGRFEGHAAIKLLNLALLTASGRERFRREGSLLARLTHPGIAHLLDAGVSATGQPFLVLEHVDGQPITAYAAARDLDLAARVALVLQVCDAVDHAHANLVVHRDLKPNNILVTGDGQVKLLDFGIAALLDANGVAAGSTLTLEGGRALTPEYAAPEQVQNGAITTATDVYSLGVLLYVLVANRHPTADGSRSAAEVVRALLEKEPARLGLGDLDTILARALRKDAPERYQTVGAFGADLRHYLRHEPVSVRADSVGYRAAKFVRRNRVGVGIATLLVATLVGALGVSLREAREAHRQRDAALEARRHADAQAAFEQSLLSEIGDRPITMREILERGRTMLERQYSGDPALLGSQLVDLSRRFSELGDTKSEKSILVRAESIATARHLVPLLADVRCEMADAALTTNDYAEARRLLTDASALLQKSPDPDIEVSCLQKRAYLATDTEHADSAIAFLRHAIALRDSSHSGAAVRDMDLYSNLAEALSRHGEPRQAIAEYERVLRMMDSSGRNGLMERNITAHNLGVVLYQIGEMQSAEPLLRDAIGRVADADHSGAYPPWPVAHFAFVSLYETHYDSARKYMSILASQGAADHDRYWEGRGLFGLIQADIGLGRLSDARQAAVRFHAISSDPKLADTDDQLVDDRLAAAWLASAAGDPATAYARATDALRAHGYFDGKRRRVFHAALMLAARSALALGKPADALHLAQGARENATRDSLSETRSAFVGEARLVEAHAQLATHDSAAARGSLERAVVALRNGAGPADPRAIEAAAMLRQLTASSR